MQVHVRLLGGFEVAVDGRPVHARDWRRQSASQLVKLLALQPGHRLLRDQVIDTLWPDLTLDAAAPRLHVASHYARGALGSAASLVLARGSLALCPDGVLTVDVDEFEKAADVARESGDLHAAAAAADLYAGPLLPEDLYEPWAEEPRERLRLRYRELLRTAGRYDALVADDPLDEDAQLAMVRDLVRQGRRSDALRSLDRMADLFRRELGVDPTPAAEQLRAEAEGLPVGTITEATSYGVPVRRTALPAARSRLVGRAVDLDQVAALLQLHRVVTIAGPGGAGKSTLALAHARTVQSDGEEAGGVDVVLAELAPVRDEAGVTRVVAEAAGIQGEGAVRTGTLAALLGSRPLLLVLDNCEHLLDASADLVDAILDAGPQARVLVTSREPLRVDGEAVHRIASLGAESAELFVERAVAAAGAGVATVDDPRVVDLCERLDGLPLAIELAAAQLRHLTLTELVDRLDDRLTLLVGGRPKAGERHSALSATIEWSYRLLSADAREVFDRLGVFPADFDLDAVVAVSPGAAGTVTNLLGDLVAKSLVVHDPATGRYRLLETIRLFAARRLAESGRDAEVTELLRRHVVRRATRMSRVRTWLSSSTAARSRDDLANVRLAFEASLAAGELADAVDVALGVSTLWRNAVSYAEGRRWVSDLLAQDLDPEDRLWALFLAADIGLGSGEPVAMREAALEAKALSDRIDDEGGAVLAAIYHALVHLADPSRAVPRLEEAGARARAALEPGLERVARSYRMLTLRIRGPDETLDAEVRALLANPEAREYDRYICIWVCSLLALVDRDGSRLRGLMDTQLSDLTANELRENWLTMYWEALTMIAEGKDYVAQLRSARRRAEEEGRQVDPDCVLALAYAAACRDEWEPAAAMLGAVAGDLRHDTAGFLHLVLVRDQLVRPHLAPEAFAAATARGERLDVPALLVQHGL